MYPNPCQTNHWRSICSAIKTLAALVAALKDSANALRTEPVDIVRLDKALTVLQTSQENAIRDMIPELGSARWATSSASAPRARRSA